jgi:hypothetical protein
MPRHWGAYAFKQRLGILFREEFNDSAPLPFASGPGLPDLPGLQIDGVGDISLPIQPEYLPKLHEALSIINETNEKSQNYHAIPANKFKFANPDWERKINRFLSKLSYQLGDIAEAQVHQLIISETGATPKIDIKPQAKSFAKLIIQLPSKYTGGTLTLHDLIPKICNLGAESGQSAYKNYFVSFYHDLPYEWQPITSGVQVLVVYDLLSSADYVSTLNDVYRNLGDLTEVIQAYNQEIDFYPMKKHYKLSDISGFGLEGLKHEDKQVALHLIRLRDIMPVENRFDLFIYVGKCIIEEFGSDRNGWQVKPNSEQQKEYFCFDLKGKQLKFTHSITSAQWWMLGSSKILQTSRFSKQTQYTATYLCFQPAENSQFQKLLLEIGLPALVDQIYNRVCNQALLREEQIELGKNLLEFLRRKSIEDSSVVDQLIKLYDFINDPSLIQEFVLSEFYLPKVLAFNVLNCFFPKLDVWNNPQLQTHVQNVVSGWKIGECKCEIANFLANLCENSQMPLQRPQEIKPEQPPNKETSQIHQILQSWLCAYCKDVLFWTRYENSDEYAFEMISCVLIVAKYSVDIESTLDWLDTYIVKPYLKYNSNGAHKLAGLFVSNENLLYAAPSFCKRIFNTILQGPLWSSMLKESLELACLIPEQSWLEKIISHLMHTSSRDHHATIQAVLLKFDSLPKLEFMKTLLDYQREYYRVAIDVSQSEDLDLKATWIMPFAKVFPSNPEIESFLKSPNMSVLIRDLGKNESLHFNVSGVGFSLDYNRFTKRNTSSVELIKTREYLKELVSYEVAAENLAALQKFSQLPAKRPLAVSGCPAPKKVA